MKIKEIQIGEMQIPLVTPFRTALRTVEAVDDIVIRVIGDNGMEGFGEAPPTLLLPVIPRVPFALRFRILSRLH